MVILTSTASLVFVRSQNKRSAIQNYRQWSLANHARKVVSRLVRRSEQVCRMLRKSCMQGMCTTYLFSPSMFTWPRVKCYVEDASSARGHAGSSNHTIVLLQFL